MKLDLKAQSASFILTAAFTLLSFLFFVSLRLLRMVRHSREQPLGVFLECSGVGGVATPVQMRQGLATVSSWSGAGELVVVGTLIRCSKRVSSSASVTFGCP